MMTPFDHELSHPAELAEILAKIAADVSGASG
jgi:hypothetical protein